MHKELVGIPGTVITRTFSKLSSAHGSRIRIKKAKVQNRDRDRENPSVKFVMNREKEMMRPLMKKKKNVEIIKRYRMITPPPFPAPSGYHQPLNVQKC